MVSKKGYISITLVLLVLLGAALACDLPFSSSSSPTSLPPAPTATSIPPSPTPLVLSDMHLNLVVGDVFHVRMISDQVITQTMEGQTEESSQVIGFGFTYSVIDIDDDGNITMNAVYEWAQFEQESSLGSVYYDSSNPPEEIPDAAIGFHALVGNGLSMKFSSEGEVIEISGLNDMYDSMLDSMEITDPELRDLVESALKEQFGEEAFMQQAGNLMIEYPPGALQVGDSWTATVDSSPIVPMNVETTYTLLSISGNVARFDVYSVVTPSTEGELMDLGTMQLGYSMSGVQEGFMEMDVESGWMMNSALNQSVSGEMIVYVDGEELNVPMTIESTTTMETTRE